MKITSILLAAAAAGLAMLSFSPGALAAAPVMPGFIDYGAIHYDSIAGDQLFIRLRPVDIMTPAGDDSLTAMVLASVLCSSPGGDDTTEGGGAGDPHPTPPVGDPPADPAPAMIGGSVFDGCSA